MDMHSCFLSVLLLTCWSAQLSYGNPMSLNSDKQMTTQAYDQQMNTTDHEIFINGSLPLVWLRGGDVEANTIFDGEAVLPPDEAKLDLEDRAINTCDCAPVTTSSSNDNRQVEDACS